MPTDVDTVAEDKAVNKADFFLNPALSLQSVNCQRNSYKSQSLKSLMPFIIFNEKDTVANGNRYQQR